MGYINNSRPTERNVLLLDAIFDLRDLKEDIKQQRSPEELERSIEFIKESLERLYKLR